MNKLLLLTLAVSLNSFAGSLDVDCGTLKSVKERRKNPLPGVVIKLLTPGFRMQALKVKLTNATNYKSNGSYTITSEPIAKAKQKRAYASQRNYDKHLKLLSEAMKIQESSSRDVHVCYGEVKGFDRWHKVASYSTISEKEAMDELIKKYR